MFEPPGSLGDAASIIFNFPDYRVIDAAARPRSPATARAFAVSWQTIQAAPPAVAVMLADV